MKSYKFKIFLTSFLLFLSYASFGQTGNGTIEVDMKKFEGAEPRPRTLTLFPSVWVDVEYNFISVLFYRPQSTSYTLTVIDSNNIVILRTTIATNGVANTYNIDFVNSGFYKIIIYNDNELFFGEIFL